MITAIFILLAAICKAVADTLYHHYDTSVFARLNPKWWNPVVSCNYVGFIPFTEYRPDGWHIANSLMIVAFIAAAVLHRSFASWWVEVIAFGIGFNIIFSLFYNKILR